MAPTLGTVWIKVPDAPGPSEDLEPHLGRSPTAVPALPAIAGVESAVLEPSAGESIETTGSTKSPTRVNSAVSVPEWPASSTCSTSKL